MTGQVLGIGCKVLRGSGTSPETFANIGHLITGNGPQFTTNEQEVTDGDSSGREYLPQFADPGQFQFTMNKEIGLASQDTLFTDITSFPQTLKNYRIQPTSSATHYYEGAAFVRDLAFTFGARGDPYEINGALRLSGAWTEAP